MKQLTEHIYYTEAVEETDQPFIYYINGSKYSVQVDAGNSLNNVLNFHKERKELNLRKPSLCIISHWHWDHSCGLHALDYPSISSVKTYEYLLKASKWIWTKDALDKRVKDKEEIEFYAECIVNYPSPEGNGLVTIQW